MNRTWGIEELLQAGALTARFEPVLEVSGATRRLHYFEGLVRGPRGTELEDPMALFEHARGNGAEALLDRACLRTILSAARELPSDAAVGVNIQASTLTADPGLPGFLADVERHYHIAPERVVLEVVEHGLVGEPVGLRDALDRIRGAGVRIALDDIGRGQANYLMMLECRPDYFKIDGYFLRGVDADPARWAVLRSVADLALSCGGRAVAECVETETTLAVAYSAGIRLAQGYLFSRSPRWRELSTGEPTA